MKKIISTLCFILATTTILVSCANKNNSSVRTESALIEPPPDKYTYFFESYVDLKKALTEADSEKYVLLRAKQNKYGTVYQDTLYDLENGIAKIAVPKLDGYSIDLQNREGFSNISLHTCELYNLPWIWYRCVVGEFDLDVEVSYLSSVKTVDVAKDKSYCEVLSIIAPDAPSPNNYGQFTSYKCIYEKNIRMANGEDVRALISELKDSSKIYVMLHLNNVLVTLCADRALFTDSFWQSFSIDFETA